MKIVHNIIILLFLMTPIGFISCERDNDMIGPNLEDLYGDFKILDPLKSSLPEVDFNIGEKAHFTARFSLITEWELKVIGKQSGAVKIFTGISKTLDIDNTLWNGSTNIFPMFRIEDCEVELRTDKDTTVQYTAIKVNGLKNNPGSLIADFESGINPGWDIFVQTGANMSFIITDSVPAAQGHYYYDMGGAVDWDWLIGYIYFPASAYGPDGFNLSTNPDNEYFNVILYLPAGITNALVLFQFQEDDNEDGIFNPANEDQWSLEIKNLEVGWQLISVRYTDLVTLVNGQPAPPAGNGLHEPNKLWQLTTLMLADPSSGYSRTYMDYLIFTQNGPLQP